MFKYLYIFTLLPIFVISQEYQKNISEIISVSGSLTEKMKSKNGKMFLYEKIGNEDYILDSTNIVSGKFSFDKRLFFSGVYKLAFNNINNSLDFVINPKDLSDKSINIEINNYRINNNYNINNSLENKIKKLYFIKEEEVQSKIKLIKKSQKTRDQKIQEINSLKNEIFQYGLSLNNEFPGTYYGMIISKMQSPYPNVSHLYFNDIDFTDQCIVRSSLLPTRIQSYIQKFNDYKNNKYGFHDAIDVVMDYAKKNEKVAEFCMYNMLDGFYNTGQTSSRDNDKIWDNLCDYIMNEYIFGEGCGDDIEPSDLLKERAQDFKKLQIGSIPPNISAKDINNRNFNLENICKKNDYTVIMFWASHCNHCMAEMPGFANWYNNTPNRNFEIVAVSLDGQKSKWEKTVEENNFNWTNICQFKVYKSPICLDYKIKKTPSIFVLNNNMEIVLKPKSTNQLRSFLLANK